MPQAESAAKQNAQSFDAEERRFRWEVELAAMPATSTRKISRVVDRAPDVQKYMNNFKNESQLRSVNQDTFKNPVFGNWFSVPGTACLHPQIPKDEELESNRHVEWEEEDSDLVHREVPPQGVIQGLTLMLTSPDATEKAKAAAALCNICSETGTCINSSMSHDTTYYATNI